MILVNFEMPRIESYVIKSEVVDMPCVVDGECGAYYASFTGALYRVCTRDYCLNAIFPSREAVVRFIADLGGYSVVVG